MVTSTVSRIGRRSLVDCLRTRSALVLGGLDAWFGGTAIRDHRQEGEQALTDHIYQTETERLA